MAEQDTTTTDDTLGQLANEIGEQGEAEDNALKTLAKGAAAALVNLSEMAKGKGAKSPNNDDENEATGDTGTDGDDSEGEDNSDKDVAQGDGIGSSYDDMNLGNDVGEEYVDATQFVTGLDKRLTEMSKMIKARDVEIDGLKATVDTVLEEQRAFMSNLAKVLGPMHKGVMDLQGRMLDIEAPAVGDGRITPVIRKRHNVDATNAELPPVAKMSLLKGLQKGIFTEDQHRNYKAAGVFVVDATGEVDVAADADIRKKLSELP